MPRKPKTPPPEAPVEPLDPMLFQVVRAGEIWSYDDTGHRLTLEESLFVRSYIIDRNPAAALRRLGYDYEVDRLKRMSTKYLANPEVTGAIDFLGKRIMERLEVTAEKVQRRIAAVAFFDPREVMQFDAGGVTLLHSRYWTADQIAAVQSVEMGQNGIKIKLYDGLRATEMLAKQLGTLPDETAEGAALAIKAAASAVIEQIIEVFDRTVPDPSPVVVPELSAPETIQ